MAKRAVNYRLGVWGNRRYNLPVTIHNPLRPGEPPPGDVCDPAITLQDQNGGYLLDENDNCIWE